MRKPVLAVVGSAAAAARAADDARELGALAAARGWVVVTGGRAKGVMAAALRGAKSGGGFAIGILPDAIEEVAPDADVAVITGMGEARNNVIVLTADVVVACGVDGAGTASEVALAIKNNRHVVLLTASRESVQFFASIAAERRELLHVAGSPQEAMECAERCLAPSSRADPRSRPLS
jgi:uncharacterized protein (TIGR00725 family)